METQTGPLTPMNAPSLSALRYENTPSPLYPLLSSPPFPCISELASAVQRIELRNDRSDATLKLIDRLGCGYVVLDQYQKILKINAVSQRIVDRADSPIAGDASARSQRVLQELIKRANGRFCVGSLTWIATSSRHGVNAALDQVEEFTTDRTSIIALLDLDILPAPNPTTLKRLFGLTFAEARLAFHLAQGSTPDDIAKILRVSRTTVRTQLAAIFSKTHTKRQATLVALLSRIAVLP